MDMSRDGVVSLAIKDHIHPGILYICVFQELKHLWTNNKANLTRALGQEKRLQGL